LIDVYALAHCVEIRTAEIFDGLKKKSARDGEFTDFYTRRNDVEHAYSKLKRIEDKPSFEDVYLYLTKFLLPFAEKDETPRIWDSRNQAWNSVKTGT
jgi:hypothetical protein